MLFLQSNLSDYNHTLYFSITVIFLLVLYIVASFLQKQQEFLSLRSGMHKLKWKAVIQQYLELGFLSNFRHIRDLNLKLIFSSPTSTGPFFPNLRPPHTILLIVYTWIVVPL